MWLNRQQLADLFDRDIKTIGKHINNALKEELKDDNSVVANFATTAFLYLIVKNHVFADGNRSNYRFSDEFFE